MNFFFLFRKNEFFHDCSSSPTLFCVFFFALYSLSALCKNNLYLWVLVLPTRRISFKTKSRSYLVARYLRCYRSCWNLESRFTSVTVCVREHRIMHLQLCLFGFCFFFAIFWCWKWVTKNDSGHWMIVKCVISYRYLELSLPYRLILGFLIRRFNSVSKVCELIEIISLTYYPHPFCLKFVQYIWQFNI